MLKPREKSLRDAMSDLKRGEAMNTDYLLLCGVMWAQHASVDAREELVRALHSDDPDLRSTCKCPSRGESSFRLVFVFGKTRNARPPEHLSH